MNIYKISVKAFEKMDALLFQSMLQLVQRQLVSTWKLEDSADIMVIDVEQPEGKTFWETHQSGPLMIAYARQNVYNAQWFLQKPIRVQPLVLLLNEIVALQTTNELANQARLVKEPAKSLMAVATKASAIAGPAAVVTATKTSTIPAVKKPAETVTAPAVTTKRAVVTPATPETTTFIPSHYLIGVLEQAVKRAQPKRLMCPGQPPLYVLPQERRCFTSLVPKQLVLSPQSIYALPAEQIESVDLGINALRAEVEKQALPGCSLDTILWLTALHTSHGRLLHNLSKQTPVGLKQWPNFAILPHNPSQMNIAAFMLKKTVDLSTAAAKTQLPLATVIDFFNACKVLGLVIEAAHVETVPAKEVKDVQDSKRDLFRSILTRLRQTSGS